MPDTLGRYGGLAEVGLVLRKESQWLYIRYPKYEIRDAAVPDGARPILMPDGASMSRDDTGQEYTAYRVETNT